MTILVTGAAGFIGAHVCRGLQLRGVDVIGVDNFNDYYDPRLKKDRVAALCSNVEILKIDIADVDAMGNLFANQNFSGIIHLAAQAGVRYSLENPQAYVQSNLVGFANIIELARRHNVSHTVYASSSSVYGNSNVAPFEENQRVDHPVSFYAATKVANELMAFSYAKLYELRLTGLRLFTVYGKWGRPDMAPVLFSRAALENRPIKVFNNGNLTRDFTHIDDITDGVLKAFFSVPDCVEVPHQVFNLGNHRPTRLMDFIKIIESAAGTDLQKEFVTMQPGDVHETMADIQLAREVLGFDPRGQLEDLLPSVVNWCRDYFT